MSAGWDILLYKSSLKAETDGLLADHSGYAFETTTGMRKQGDQPGFRIAVGLRQHEVRSNPWTYIFCGASLKAETDGLLADHSGYAFETTTGACKAGMIV